MKLALYDLFLDWVATLPKPQRKLAISLFVDFADFIDEKEKDTHNE